MNQPQRPGATAVVEQLAAEGVDVIFGIPGIHLMQILDSLHDRPDVRYVTTRHEQATTYMADGYARTLGREGVALVVPGPGVYNAGAGLATAFAASSPVFMLAGQVDRAGIGKGNSLPHEVHDQLDIVRPVTKFAERVTDVDRLPQAIHDAFVAMRSGRPRPAHLEVPPDVFAQPTAAPVVAVVDTPPTHADATAIASAAALLAAAANPLIVAGGGIHAAGASRELTALAERLDAAVVTTREGKGSIDERNPLALGAVFVHRRLQPALEAADVVLAVGTRFQGLALRPDQRLIHLDVDEAEIGRFRAPDVALVGDAKVGLRALLDETGDCRPATDDRRGSLAAFRAEVDAALDAVGPQAAFVKALRRGLPEDGIAVVDATMVGYMCHLAFPVYAPRSYLTSSYMGTLGFALPMALGAKIACPDRPVLCVSGDGGFLFSGSELATAVQYGLGVVSVVFNDSAYGNTRLDQVTNYDGRILGTELHNPDFIAYAESFGAAGIRVKSPDELAGAVAEACADTRPAVIEVPIDPLPSAF